MADTLLSMFLVLLLTIVDVTSVKQGIYLQIYRGVAYNTSRARATLEILIRDQLANIIGKG